MAAALILTRERGGPRIARQILLMLMLDERTTTPISWLFGYHRLTVHTNAGQPLSRLPRPRGSPTCRKKPAQLTV